MESSNLNLALGHPHLSWFVKRIGPPVFVWIIAGSILPQ